VDQFVLIAKIIALHGSDGFLVINSFSDFSERFYDLEKVFIEFFGTKKEFDVEEVDKRKGKYLLKLSGFSSADDAKIFIGRNVFIEEINSVELSDDSYFIHDLIGCSVFKEKVLLGSVTDVLVLPANDVYVIECEDNRKILLPAIKDCIKKIDPVKKRIDLVPGCELLYDDEN